MTNAEILGNKLYELRKQAGFSQEELADKLSVSRQAISKWERGEALPDTDNLISIARLYNVSLDYLIGNVYAKTESAKADEKPENEDKNNGIHVEIEDEDDKIIIDLSDGSTCVKAPSKPDDFDDDEDDDSDTYYSYTDNPNDKKRNVLKFFHSLPYPIIVTIAFLLWGFLWDGFSVSWTLFITIPVYYSIIDCFRKRNVSNFLYPVFITFVFCFLGMQWNLWHPYWILYLTIPVFYAIANAIDRKN